MKIYIVSIGVGNRPRGPLGHPAQKLRDRYFGPGRAGYGPGRAGYGPGRAGYGPGRAGYGPGRAGYGPGRAGQALRAARPMPGSRVGPTPMIVSLLWHISGYL